jgi:hypothetical protein
MVGELFPQQRELELVDQRFDIKSRLEGMLLPKLTGASVEDDRRDVRHVSSGTSALW